MRPTLKTRLATGAAIAGLGLAAMTGPAGALQHSKGDDVFDRAIAVCEAGGGTASIHIDEDGTWSIYCFGGTADGLFCDLDGCVLTRVVAAPTLTRVVSAPTVSLSSPFSGGLGR